ncbi:MAG: TIM barrel protein [Planctomycetota bacterium]
MIPTTKTSTILLNRRSTLRTAAVAGLAAVLHRPLRAIADHHGKGKHGPLPYANRLGLQLYTVRNQMAEDPVATLEAVAKAGYAQVELMNIDQEAVKLAAIARDNGMAVHSAFMNWQAITSPDQPNGPSIDETIDLAQRIGLRHVVFGYIGKDARNTADKIRKIADTANMAGEKTRHAGMRMCYHNHSFEFEPIDGKRSSFDLFVKRFDPQKIEFELDVFWAKLGGRDPEELMRTLSGRISQVHLKNLKEGVETIYDEGLVPADAFQEAGDGIIEMANIMKLAKKIGVDQCHVEQDQSPAPLDSIRESIDFLRA